MKCVKSYKIGDNIPENAKFITVAKLEYFNDDVTGILLYEVPIKEERTAPAKAIDLTPEVISYLNQVTGKRFLPNGGQTKAFIRARVNEGFTIDDFKRVIDKKGSDWLEDPQMNTYLRPSTLFGTKFESYLNATTGNEMADAAISELDSKLSQIQISRGQDGQDD